MLVLREINFLCLCYVNYSNIYGSIMTCTVNLFKKWIQPCLQFSGNESVVIMCMHVSRKRQYSRFAGRRELKLKIYNVRLWPVCAYLSPISECELSQSGSLRHLLHYYDMFTTIWNNGKPGFIDYYHEYTFSLPKLSS